VTLQEVALPKAVRDETFLPAVVPLKLLIRISFRRGRWNAAVTIGWLRQTKYTGLAIESG